MKHLTAISFVLSFAILPQIDTERTVWDGVYNEAQAQRGALSYTRNCGGCHMENLAGQGEVPALKGTAFMDRWRDYSLLPLLSLIKTEMPPLRFRTPGTPKLSDETYTDILTYLLKANDFPAGNSELALDALDKVQIVGREGPAPPPNFALVLVVGCMALTADSRWVVAAATEPVRATMPDITTAEELRASLAKQFGTRQFRLADFGYLGAEFRPESLRGQKIQVKGYLIRQREFERISVTSLQTVASRCG